MLIHSIPFTVFSGYSYMEKFGLCYIWVTVWRLWKYCCSMYISIECKYNSLQIPESVNLWIVPCCLFSQMNTEYKSISVSHIYTACLTDAVHLMAACPSGSRDCRDFFQLSHQMHLRTKKKLLQNAPGSQLWRVCDKKYVNVEINVEKGCFPEC